ncbi:MAG: flagellar biosynthetic protein FliR [Alphaproteobacteria bacterium]
MLAELVTANLYQVFIVFARVGAAMMVLPGFGEAFVYARARLGLALLVSAALAPIAAPTLPPIPADGIDALLLVGREALVGLAVGTVVRLLVSAVTVAGSLVATQTGLATASAFDPTQGDQLAVIGRFLTIAATVALFATDLHLTMLAAIAETYSILPPTGLPPVGDVSALAFDWFGAAFRVSVELAAPLIVAGVVFFLGLGVLARLMPQVPVFFVIMPVQIGFGIALFTVALSTMLLWYVDFVADRLATFVTG